MKLKSIFRFVIILLGCLSLLIGVTVYSQAQNSNNQITASFYKANELFGQGNYDKAEKVYQEILASGMHSGNIYYNLGNTFFKQGQLGKAIVNYERAKRLLPYDRDVQANLKYALSLCNNSIVPLKKFGLIRLMNNITECLTLDVWTILLSAAYFMVLVSFAFFMIKKTAIFKKVAVFLLFCLIMISCLWLVKFQWFMLDKQAIIIVSEVDSRFAPALDAVVHFKAYEGAGIEIIDQNSAWVRIKTPDGKIGWVPNISVEKI